MWFGISCYDKNFIDINMQTSGSPFDRLENMEQIGSNFYHEKNEIAQQESQRSFESVWLVA